MEEDLEGEPKATGLGSGVYRGILYLTQRIESIVQPLLSGNNIRIL